MSYDLAVWEGERPAHDRAARWIWRGLYERYLDSDDGEVEEPPSEGIAAYVAALLERWCDITEEEAASSPWSSGPLIGNASGPVIYFGMSWSMAEEASAYAADLANSMGLVCFDVQQNGLRP